MVQQNSEVNRLNEVVEIRMRMLVETKRKTTVPMYFDLLKFSHFLNYSVDNLNKLGIVSEI